MENELNRSVSENPSVRQEETMTFGHFIHFIRRFLVLIVAFALFGVGAGLGYALARDKTVYTQSKSAIVIAKIDNKSMSTNISLTNKYLATIKDIITTPVFIAKANEIYKQNNQGGLSAAKIDVKSGGGMILTISYSDDTADDAAKKLDAFIEGAREEIQGRITADEVDLVPIDNVPKLSTSNGFAKFVLLGLLAGLVLGFGFAFLFYILDNTVNNKSDLERITGATVVAFIEDVSK